MKSGFIRTGKAVLPVVLALFLTACGGALLSPEAVVERYCAALKDFDQEAASRYLDSVQEDEEELIEETVFKIPDSGEIVEILKEQSGKMQYAVRRAEQEDGRASVTVEFTYPDVSEAMAAAIPDYVVKAMEMAFAGAGQTEITREFAKIFRKKTAETGPVLMQTQVEFICTETDKGWKITSVPEDELANILSCNIMQGFDRFREEREEASSES